MKKLYILLFCLAPLLFVKCSKEGTDDVSAEITLISNVTPTSVQVSGNASVINGSSSYLTTGVCWSTSPEPKISDNFLQAYSTSYYNIDILNLQPRTTYYLRAYSTYNGSNYYGLTQLVKTPHSDVGTFKEGGIVFWVNPNDTTKGLVCSLTNVGNNSASWSITGILFGASGIEIGDGLSNTTTVASTGANSAAKYCYDYSSNGYSDWFLPSKKELKLLIDYYYAVNLGLSNNSGFNLGGSYWSSSEIDANNAWGIDLYSNSYIQNIKTQGYKVRAIRAY